MRVGVDRKAEEREVRRVLAQRKLDVVAEVRSPDFLAIGAESIEGNHSAVRVITGRGVMIAEDAQLDDLFAPGSVALLDQFPSRLNDLTLVGFVRSSYGSDAGCVSLRRIMPDGTVVEVVLDVSAFGSRACVLSLQRGARARLDAEVGFPNLALGETAAVRVQLAFKTVPLGKPDPVVRVARAVENSEVLELERQRLNALGCAGAELPARHAIGLARAALSLFTGESTDRQVAAYRECLGIVRPGSREADVVAETLQHMEQGWLDDESEKLTADGAAENASGAGSDLVIDAESSEPDDPDQLLIEPNAPAASE